MFTNIFSNVESVLTVQTGILCTAVSVVLGFAIAWIYMQQGNYTKNFVMTLVLLPPLVQLVIMMVNGNLGTSVAILGTFGLVRFRSVPGNSKEIISVFFAMAVGLATGIGYLTFAAMVVLLVGLIFILLVKIPFGEAKQDQRHLRITIAENIDYTTVFDEVFQTFLKKWSLERVRTTNLGSMYEIEYFVHLKNSKQEKEMIDAIRCRNGNLTIICGRYQGSPGEL